MARTRNRPRRKNGIAKQAVVNTTIALAEDRVLVRQGIRALLEREAGFQIVGEAGNGLETIQLIESLKPDVLVLDLILPGLNGLEVARRIRNAALPTRIVVLTQHARESYVTEAFRNGASGYVLKELPSDELVRAIREVQAGRTYLSSTLSHIRIEEGPEETGAGGTEKPGILTARQREIVQLVAEGKSSREIGARLGLSTRTVETHRANAMRQLGLRKQTDLVRYAFNHGMILSDAIDAAATTTGTTGSQASERV